MASVKKDEMPEWRRDILSSLIKEFCSVTNASQETAKTLLERKNFTLQDAINEYFESGDPIKPSNEGTSGYQSAANSIKSNERTLTLLTWNIDGLDEEDLRVRILAVTDQINTLNPDVVYLQEVIDVTLEFIKRHCKGYEVYYYEDNPAPYFSAVMLKKQPSLRFISKEIINFPNSRMGRFLLCVDIMFHGQPLTLMTSHLESTGPAKSERIRQLGICFKKICSIGEQAHVILAGDLNLRDDEVTKVGGLNDGIKDAWIESGSEYGKKFTWDMSQNDNLVMPGNGKPKLRFDRMFYKSSVNQKMEVTSFDLIGKERLKICDRFVSDHWGILCKFLLSN